MAQADSGFITRRSLVAASAAVPLAAVAPSPVLVREADPIFAAIAAHRSVYAAFDAQVMAGGDDEAADRLGHSEREMADRLAATVPTTLEGVAAALAYVRQLDEDDGYPLFDDDGWYALIASTETAIRHALRLIEANTAGVTGVLGL